MQFVCKPKASGRQGRCLGSINALLWSECPRALGNVKQIAKSRGLIKILDSPFSKGARLGPAGSTRGNARKICVTLFQ